MDNHKIQSILRNALEEEIPSSEINLWPNIQDTLVKGNQPAFQQGETMNTTQSRRIMRLAFASLILIALIAITLTTPPGRALAQSIFQFFTRTDEQTFSLEPHQIVIDEPDPNAPTAEPPAPLVSIAEAETQAGFAAAELPTIPSGFNYLGARSSRNTISIEYEAKGGGGALNILQSRTGFDSSRWEQVPVEAIVPVKIGELDGEFAQGIFVVYPGDTSATWNPDAPILRLRWVDQGIWFEITKQGNVEVIEYLDQNGLIELAKSLISQP